MPSNILEIRPQSSAVGAEIRGIDLAEPILDETLSTIRHTLADRGVVFFRDQRLTPEQHIAFAQRVGNININRFFAHGLSLALGHSLLRLAPCSPPSMTLRAASAVACGHH